MKPDRPVAPFFYDSVGRRRKLSQLQILKIQALFAEDAKVSDLAERFGVSVSLIRTITYTTARNRDLERVNAARSDVQPDTP